MEWKIQVISATADVSGFHSGEPTLDSFLKKHALPNNATGLGRTFVAMEPESSRVAGYFTISSGSVRFDAIPKHSEKRLPKYPIPTIHLGRLAVDVQFQGRGLGETLLVEAMKRSVIVASEVGVYAIDVFALHERAKAFYLKYGFVQMLDQPLHLILPMATVGAVAKDYEA